MQLFPSQQDLNNHSQYDCNKICSILPSSQLKKCKTGEMIPENILKFTSYEKQLTVPFIIYADFECLLQEIQDAALPNASHIHVPYSFAYKIVCSFNPALNKFVAYKIVCSFNPALNKFVTYTGLDSPKVFISKLTEDAHYIYNTYLKHCKPMQPLNSDEQIAFDNSELCYICQSALDDTKVRDHCHLTGTFRGAAHSKCNLNFKIQKFIPIIFHNLSGYDLHLFVKDLAYDYEAIDILPQNKEKYISLSKSLIVDKYVDKSGVEKSVYLKLRFLDSFRFMASSIDKLAKNLAPEIAIQMERLKVLYNKPTYIGFAVLDLSKLLMYDFYYNFLKPLYNDNVPRSI
ncbi:Recombination endonuclease VII [Popillia japonica]|uniref:Recombination endonuclease VII n=1 Tax=Popillia japonica TaxID=7064 RepID=A0AAW1MZB5_POPJA